MQQRKRTEETRQRQDKMEATAEGRHVHEADQPTNAT